MIVKAVHPGLLLGAHSDVMVGYQDSIGRWGCSPEESRVPPIGLDWFSKRLETRTAGKYYESPSYKTKFDSFILQKKGSCHDSSHIIE